MVVPIHLEKAGAKWWHSEDYHSPNLSKSSLGEFFFHVLSVGAYVGEIWPFNYNYKRSSVYVSIFATEEQIRQIEENTKFRFKLPPKIRVN